MLQHWWLSPPELFAFTIQDAHHASHPSTSCSRSIPLHMSRRKSLIGCHVVVRARENVTTAMQAYDGYHVHTGSVPGHHHHETARHIPRLMLHYSPRFRTCWDARHRATLHARPCREGACLDVSPWWPRPRMCPNHFRDLAKMTLPVATLVKIPYIFRFSKGGSRLAGVGRWGMLRQTWGAFFAPHTPETPINRTFLLPR